MTWLPTDDGYVRADCVIKFEQHSSGSLTLRLMDGSNVKASGQNASAVLKDLAPQGLPNRATA
jgi:hypothetical protein